MFADDVYIYIYTVQFTILPFPQILALKVPHKDSANASRSFLVMDYPGRK